MYVCMLHWIIYAWGKVKKVFFQKFFLSCRLSILRNKNRETHVFDIFSQALFFLSSSKIICTYFPVYWNVLILKGMSCRWTDSLKVSLAMFLSCQFSTVYSTTAPFLLSSYVQWKISREKKPQSPHLSACHTLGFIIQSEINGNEKCPGENSRVL